MAQWLTCKTRTLVLLALMLIVWHGDAASALQKNDLAPMVSLRDSKGQFFHLSSFIGNKRSEKFKGVVINFFSSGCIPCRSELPVLDSMVAELSASGVKVVIIGYREDFDRISKFLDSINVHGPIVLSDPYGKAGEKYGVYSLPLTVILDGDGVIREIVRGELPDLRAAIKRALQVR